MDDATLELAAANTGGLVDSEVFDCSDAAIKQVSGVW